MDQAALAKALSPFSNPVAGSSLDDWLLHGAFAELRRRGLMSEGSSPPPRVVKNAAPNWESQSEPMRVLLERGLGPSPTTAHRWAIGQVAMRALAEYLENRGPPICLRVLLTNINKLPAAMEQSFPGYIQSQLLCFLFTSGIETRGRSRHPA